MPRYIDADALGIGYANPKVFNSEEYARGWNSVIEIINSAPTVSPDEVRGVGKWIKREKVRKNLPADSDYLYSCSVCGCGDEHNENVSVPFCWHCGAKMEVTSDA